MKQKLFENVQGGIGDIAQNLRDASDLLYEAKWHNIYKTKEDLMSAITNAENDLLAYSSLFEVDIFGLIAMGMQSAIDNRVIELTKEDS